LGTIHKKIIGSDGLKNEYLFHNAIPNKIIIKHPQKNNNNYIDNNNFTWTEINTEEEIKILIDSLSDKGIREQFLSNKIKKLLSKKLKLSNTNSNKEIQNGELSEKEEKEKEKEKILKKLLGNDDNNNKIKTKKENNRNEGRFLSQIFENLDEQISDYLLQDKKEWEEFIIRADLKAFINASEDEKEIAKCLILLNDRFKNPFRINEFKNNINNKIISDEEDYINKGYIDSNMKIDLMYIDENKVVAPKSKLKNLKYKNKEEIKIIFNDFLYLYIYKCIFVYLIYHLTIIAKVWSSEFLDIELEESYINYLKNTKSIKSLIFACIFYTGITEYLIKRRDVYRHYKKRDTDNNNNYNYNNRNNNINLSDESKKDNKKNNNIIDDIEDFYFDEDQFEIHSKINKERNAKNNINDYDYNGAGFSKRSTRNKDSNIYKDKDIDIDMNVNLSISGKANNNNITPKVKI
jgi:hypothetical protein